MNPETLRAEKPEIIKGGENFYYCSLCKCASNRPEGIPHNRLCVLPDISTWRKPMNPEPSNPGVSEDEAFVRERWEHVTCCVPKLVDPPEEPFWWVELGRFVPEESGRAVVLHTLWDDPSKTAAAAWAAARAFTEARLREIAEREEEIREVICARSEWQSNEGETSGTAAIYGRILQRLQADLSEKRKGLWETKDSAQPAQEVR